MKIVVVLLELAAGAFVVLAIYRRFGNKRDDGVFSIVGTVLAVFAFATGDQLWGAVNALWAAWCFHDWLVAPSRTGGK